MAWKKSGWRRAVDSLQGETPLSPTGGEGQGEGASQGPITLFPGFSVEKVDLPGGGAELLIRATDEGKRRFERLRRRLAPVIPDGDPVKIVLWMIRAYVDYLGKQVGRARSAAAAARPAREKGPAPGPRRHLRLAR